MFSKILGWVNKKVCAKDSFDELCDLRKKALKMERNIEVLRNVLFQTIEGTPYKISDIVRITPDGVGFDEFFSVDNPVTQKARKMFMDFLPPDVDEKAFANIMFAGMIHPDGSGYVIAFVPDANGFPVEFETKWQQRFLSSNIRVKGHTLSAISERWNSSLSVTMWTPLYSIHPK